MADLGGSIDQADSLRFYGWFKQIKKGDCGTKRPTGLADMAGKAKWDAWDAWDAVRGLGAAEAIELYVKRGTELVAIVSC